MRWMASLFSGTLELRSVVMVVAMVFDRHVALWKNYHMCLLIHCHTYFHRVLLCLPSKDTVNLLPLFVALLLLLER